MPLHTRPCSHVFTHQTYFANVDLSRTFTQHSISKSSIRR